MASIIKNTRELRSFRIRYKTKNIFSFLKDENSFGGFFFCEVLQPKDRIFWREEFNKANLELVYISKNIARFILRTKKWVQVYNLMQGGVILIRDRLGRPIEENNFQLILKHKKFFFRFLYWKYSLYRYEKIKGWIKKNIGQKDQVRNFFVLLMYIYIYIYSVPLKRVFFS